MYPDQDPDLSHNLIDSCLDRTSFIQSTTINFHEKQSTTFRANKSENFNSLCERN